MQQRKIPNRIIRALRALSGKETPELKAWKDEIARASNDVEKLKKQLDVEKNINVGIYLQTGGYISYEDHFKENQRIAKLYPEREIEIGQEQARELRAEEEIRKIAKQKFQQIVGKFSKMYQQDSPESSQDSQLPAKVAPKDSVLKRLKKTYEALVGKDVENLSMQEWKINKQKDEVIQEFDEKNSRRQELESLYVEKMIKDEPASAKHQGQKAALEKNAAEYAKAVGIEGKCETVEIHASRLISNRLQNLQSDLECFIRGCESFLGKSKEEKEQGDNSQYKQSLKSEIELAYSQLLGRVYGELAVMIEAMKKEDLKKITISNRSLEDVIKAMPNIFGTGVRDTLPGKDNSKEAEKYQLPSNSIAGWMQEERKNKPDGWLIDSDVASAAMKTYRDGIQGLVDIGYIIDKSERFDLARHNASDYNYATDQARARSGYAWLLKEYFGQEYNHQGLRNIQERIGQEDPLRNYKKIDRESGIPNNPQVNESIKKIWESGQKISSDNWNDGR